MAVYPYQKLNDQNNQNDLEYDLDFEKVRIEEGLEEIKESLLERWKEDYAKSPVYPNQVQTVDSRTIDFLLSFQNTLFYNDIAKKFSLTPKQRDMLPQIVWHVVMKNDWDRMQALFEHNLEVKDAMPIIGILNDRIFSKIKEVSGNQGTISQKYAEKPMTDKKVSVALQDALKAYPELGEQMVTSQRIKLKGFPDPVRPSIKNWISDYTFNFGYDRHSLVLRNNYLFQTDNTRNLTNEDRQKLSFVLKSFDERTPVEINETKKEIIFPEMEKIASRPVKNQTMPGGDQAPQDIWARNVRPIAPNPVVRTAGPVQEGAPPVKNVGPTSQSQLVRTAGEAMAKAGEGLRNAPRPNITDLRPRQEAAPNDRISSQTFTSSQANNIPTVASKPVSFQSVRPQLPRPVLAVPSSNQIEKKPDGRFRIEDFKSNFGNLVKQEESQRPQPAPSVKSNIPSPDLRSNSNHIERKADINQSGDNLRFTSPHKFPFEKEKMITPSAGSSREFVTREKTTSDQNRNNVGDEFQAVSRNVPTNQNQQIKTQANAMPKMMPDPKPEPPKSISQPIRISSGFHQENKKEANNDGGVVSKNVVNLKE